VLLSLSSSGLLADVRIIAHDEKKDAVFECSTYFEREKKTLEKMLDDAPLTSFDILDKSFMRINGVTIPIQEKTSAK
jgi:hypothetical protein